MTRDKAYQINVIYGGYGDFAYEVVAPLKPTDSHGTWWPSLADRIACSSSTFRLDGDAYLRPGKKNQVSLTVHFKVDKIDQQTIQSMIAKFQEQLMQIIDEVLRIKDMFHILKEEGAI